MVRADASPQSYADEIQSRKLLFHFLHHIPVLPRFTLSRRNIRIRGLNAKNLFRVFLVAHCDVTVLDQFWHNLSRLLPPLPEFGAIVQIARDRQAFFFGFLDSLETDVTEACADGRGYARPVEPVGIVKNLVPIYHTPFNRSYG